MTLASSWVKKEMPAQVDLYYKRAELITSVITEKYSLFEESFLDHMVEEILF